MARDVKAQRPIAPTSHFSALSAKRTDTEPRPEDRGRHRRFARGAAHRAGATLVVASSFLSACMSAGQPEPNTASETKAETKTTPDLGPQTPTSHKRQVPNLFRQGPYSKIEYPPDVLPEFPLRFSRTDLEERSIALRKGEKLIVFVDDHVRSAAVDKPFTISDLLWEDVELAPGPHFLHALRENSDGVTEIGSTAFFVEVEPRGGVTPPACVLGAIKTTLNGPKEASELHFVAVPLNAEVTRAAYTATGPGLRSEGEFPVGFGVILDGPPSGDIELSARCFAGKKELNSASVIVTVNGDAPDGEGE